MYLKNLNIIKISFQIIKILKNGRKLKKEKPLLSHFITNSFNNINKETKIGGVNEK